MPRLAAACLLLACNSGGPPSPTPSPSPQASTPATPPPSIIQTGPIKSATLRHTLAQDTWPAALAWSPDATRLATGDDSGLIKIWDPRTAQLLKTIGPYDRRISALAYSQTNQLAAAGLTDLRIWDPTTGAERHRLPGHGDIINHIKFIGDELHAVDLRGSLRRWDPRTGELLGEFEVPTIHSLSSSVSPTGDALAIGGYGDITVLDLPSRAVRFKKDMPRCDDHPGDLMCAGWKQRTVEEFGLDGAPPTLHQESGPRWYVQDLAFSADAARLLLGRADGVAILLDALRGAPLARYSLGDDDSAAVALTPDATTAALGTDIGQLSLFDIPTGRELKLLHEPSSRISALAFAPDAATLAVAGPGPAITLWDLTR